MRLTLLTAAVSVLLLSGCALSPQPMKTSFDPVEYEPYDRPGTGVIVGQAFLVTRGGDVKYGAGRTVALNPVTSHTTEWYERFVLAYERLTGGDERSQRYVRKTTADADGRFRFEGLPAGEYYLTCYIEWEYPVGVYYGGVSTATTGGIAHARVTVREGETTEAVVTR